MDVEQEPVALPSAPKKQLSPTLTLQPPLSRRGHGPGLIIVTPTDLPKSDCLDPEPLLKWAEEGYAVVQVVNKEESVEEDLRRAIVALESLEECDEKTKFGLVVYGQSGTEVIKAVRAHPEIVAIVTYGPFCGSAASLPAQLYHHAGEKNTTAASDYPAHWYPTVKSESFILPGHPDYSSSSAAVAHTRSLTFLKKHIGGPIFDLEAIWDEHAYFEFAIRDVAKTMGTMVQEPYVNHIATMTGGIGRERLTNFYRYHFIFQNPDDTVLELVSRTVGIDRVIDEFIGHLTHDKTIDWLLPGIPPTGKKLKVAMTSVVNVRGDRLYHEHIAWDQASVLVQLGLMPEYLPFPYALPDGRKPGPGKRFEYRVPAGGADVSEKLIDENAVPSNAMFEYGIREVDDK